MQRTTPTEINVSYNSVKNAFHAVLTNIAGPEPFQSYSGANGVRNGYILFQHDAGRNIPDTSQDYKTEIWMRCAGDDLNLLRLILFDDQLPVEFYSMFDQAITDLLTARILMSPGSDHLKIDRRAYENILDSVSFDDMIIKASQSTSTTEATETFNSINGLIENCQIESKLIETMLCDLGESEKCFNGDAYKSCVVMLGAIAEGLMIGTLRQDRVISRLQGMGDPPALIRSLGQNDPNLRDKLPKLTFEQLKSVLLTVDPTFPTDLVKAIQDMRNLVHPWEAANSSTIDYHTTIKRITALEMVTNHLCQ